MMLYNTNRLYGETSVNGVDYLATSYIIPNEWHKYTLVFNAPSVLFYRDGLYHSVDNTITSDNLGKWCFFGSTGQFNAPLNGSVDEIRIYNRTLTADEIYEAYYDSQWNIENNTVYINSHQYDEIVNVSINLSGYKHVGDYPTGVNIYINGTLSNEVGTVYSGDISLDELSDGNTTKDIVFNSSGFKTEYIKIPKDATVTTSNLTLSGDTDSVVDVGNGSDGALTFTASSKSFGNLVEGTDYTNTSNTLYLNLNQEYNFINFTLGEGMILSTLNTTGAVLMLRVNETTSINGIINLSNRMAYGPSSSSYSFVEGLVTNYIYSPSGYNFGIGGSSAGGYYCTGTGVPAMGNGGGQGSPFGAGGVPNTNITELGPDGYYAQDGVNAIGYSGGGAGGASGWIDSDVNHCNITVIGGAGGNSYGADGGGGSRGLKHPATWSCSWCMISNGGGGAGGLAGKPGVNLYIYGLTFNITGTIDTSGTDGGTGGDGGQTNTRLDSDTPYDAYGGSGGQGGGGANGGDVVIFYQTLNNSGTIVKSGGTGGAGGLRYNGFTRLWGASGTNGASGSSGETSLNDYTNLLNPYMKLGNLSDSPVWNYTGYFASSNTTNDLSTEINTYLSSCSEDSEGNCNIPLYFYSYTAGLLKITSVDIIYTYDVNPILLDKDLIEAFLENSVNETNIPITIESETNGTIEVWGIVFDHIGGNKTYEILAHDAFYDTNMSFNITYFYSDWDYNLPPNINYIDFYPPSPTSDGVTPFAQSNSRPILNFTNYGYGGKNADFYMLVNETETCVDLLTSANYTQPDIDLYDNESLILYMPMDIDARDISGNNIDGTTYGDIVHTGNGTIGGAYIFDGINDYISVGTDSELVSNTTTIMLWFKPSTISGLGDLVSKYANGWSVSYVNNDVITFVDSASYYMYTNNVLVADTWVHIAIVLNNTIYANTTITAYIDGAYKNTVIKSTNIIPSTADPVIIGLYGPYSYAEGVIDEVKIYNTLLTASEISNLYNRSVNKYYDTKATYEWKLIGSNTTLYDDFKTWMWADLECTYTTWRLWDPEYNFRACCIDCDICDEVY